MILFFQSLSLKTRFMAVVIAFLVLLGCFTFFNATPTGVAQFKQYAAGHALLDQQLWYTPAQALDALTAWGDKGRSWFVSALFPLDMVFPFTYGIFFSLAFLYLLKKINPKYTWLYLLPVLALGAVAFDLLENLHVLLFCLAYPLDFAFVYWTSAVCTFMKWILLVVCTGVFCLLVIFHAIQRTIRQYKAMHKEHSPTLKSEDH